MFNPLKFILSRVSLPGGLLDDVDLSDNDADPPKMPAELVALSTVREFLLDSRLSDAIEVSTLLGVPPVSDEVAEMEQRQSDARYARVMYLAPLLHSYAHTMAAGVVSFLMAQSDPEPTPEALEKWQTVVGLLEPACMATLIGGVTQMVDKRLLRTFEDAA